MTDKKLRVAVLGATGMVGQRFLALLENHPWFEVAVVAASKRSAGRVFSDVLKDRWVLPTPIPDRVASLVIQDASDVGSIASQVEFAFCAVDMRKDALAELEIAYAKAEIPIVSNNSVHRSAPDVPMVIPEVNADHLQVIPFQRHRLGVSRGFVAVKPNCSLQSYVPAIHPLLVFQPTHLAVSTYQAISGAGKTFESWPEMRDNVIPFIRGEEEKSEKEPLKIWGRIDRGVIVPRTEPVISAQCVRVPVSDGHLATVSVSFRHRPDRTEILSRWKSFVGLPQRYNLPSAPKPFLTYFGEDARPQSRLDRDVGAGMGVSVGRLRADPIFDFRFVALSHNTIRGAAGGAILTAELLVHEGYITPK
jgi:aspartate-semialdehyde dehydrogenase